MNKVRSLKVNETDERLREFTGSSFLYEKTFEGIRASGPEELVKENEALMSVIDHLPNGVSIMDTDFKVVYINSKMRELYAAGGRNFRIRCYRLFHKGQRKRCKECPAIVCRETGRPASVFNYSDPVSESGKKMYMHIHVFPILNRDGEIVAFVEYIYNLTEQLDMAEQINSLKSRLVLMERENAILRKQLEDDRQSAAELERTVEDNIRNYVKPALQYLGTRVSREEQKTFTSIIEESVFPITRRRSARGIELSSKELQIAMMIKEGMSSKQIADTLYITKKAVDYHRANIRKKLEIEPKVNLQTWLRTYM